MCRLEFTVFPILKSFGRVPFPFTAHEQPYFIILAALPPAQEPGDVILLFLQYDVSDIVSPLDLHLLAESSNEKGKNKLFSFHQKIKNKKPKYPQTLMKKVVTTSGSSSEFTGVVNGIGRNGNVLILLSPIPSSL